MIHAITGTVAMTTMIITEVVEAMVVVVMVVVVVVGEGSVVMAGDSGD